MAQRDDPRVRVIEVMSAIRSNPMWFFPGGTFQPDQAIGLMCMEALAHGSRDMLIRKFNGWWLMASMYDWLGGDTASFFAMVPDPEYGPNTIRVAVMLTAFCPIVLTAARGQRFDVVADADLKPPPEVNQRLNEPRWGRVVAFLPPLL